jgi:hypothetical protein
MYAIERALGLGKFTPIPGCYYTSLAEAMERLELHRPVWDKFGLATYRIEDTRQQETRHREADRIVYGGEWRETVEQITEVIRAKGRAAIADCFWCDIDGNRVDGLSESNVQLIESRLCGEAVPLGDVYVAVCHKPSGRWFALDRKYKYLGDMPELDTRLAVDSWDGWKPSGAAPFRQFPEWATELPEVDFMAFWLQ